MSHFEVMSNHNTETKVLEDEAAATARLDCNKMAFDFAGVDSLVVFWPDKLKDLSHLRSVDVNSTQGCNDASPTLLVGHIINGHSKEAAVIIVGVVRICMDEAVSNALESHGLTIIGSYASNADTIGGATVSDPSASSIWLRMLIPSSSHELPTILAVRFGQEEDDTTPSAHSNARLDIAPCAITLIGYAVPNTRMLQYFALESLRLAPVSGMKLVSTASALLLPDDQLLSFSKLMAANSAPSLLQNKFLRLLLLDPVHWQSFRSIQPKTGPMPRGTALRRSVELINRLQVHEQRLAHHASRNGVASNGITNGSASDQHESKGHDEHIGMLVLLGNAATSIALTIQRMLRHPLYSPEEHAVMIEGVVANPVLKRPQQPPLRLTSISACARQLDVRISQLIVAPRLASRLRYLRKQQKLPIDEIAAPYIGLWNAIWLIANDIILGHAVSVLLLQNKAQLANLGRGLVERYLLESVLWLLSWLENWPAGLKLNTELSLFFSDAYSSLTSAWYWQGLVHIIPRLETLIVIMALIGRMMGVTMVLCMVQDLVSICTLHITVFYTLSFRTLRAFVYVLSALFDLFRGKKRNALRGGRLDDASYELDQLLLGTLLFTLVAFLFPTVYVYYFAFGLIRLGVVGFEVGVVETCLGLLNHLPLFALMLRFKDPHRLPAGVWLQQVEKPSNSDAQVLKIGRYRLRSRPLTISDIFEGYGQHVGGLVEVPSMLLRCILGRPLRRPSSSQ